MYLICGLGNPGPEYIITRHNIGFLFIDYLSSKLQINNSDLKNKYKGIYSQTKFLEQNIIILKPQTFMNNSGISVCEIAKFYKILPKNVIIIHDDLDLEFSQIKSKFSGGHAGHNGLKSIDQYISNKYHRIRLGISHPRNTDIPQMSVENYVLGNFLMEEQEQLLDIFTKAEAELTKIITKEE